MNKIGIIIFLLLVTVGHYSFAERDDDKILAKNLTLNTYLKVQEIHNEGLALVLNDGSEWDIKYVGGVWKLLGWWNEQHNVSHWKVDDEIEVQYPGSGNFIDFILIINNLSQKETAVANLKKPPSVDYPACLWVVNFDEDTKRVTLSNGTIWFKTTVDVYGAFFDFNSTSQGQWATGDVLTLIGGESWFTTKHFFLWNHSTNEMLGVNRLE